MVTGMVVGAGIFIACNTLPVFGPPLACIAGELANGALEDPILIVSGCIGATITALIQAIEIELANLAGDTDASVDAVTPVPVTGDAASDGAAMTQASSGQPSATQAYKAHLQRILARAKAIQVDGGAK
jgi:hypothetical protein